MSEASFLEELRLLDAERASLEARRRRRLEAAERDMQALRRLALRSAHPWIKSRPSQTEADQ
jgi:hypothetical protein